MKHDADFPPPGRGILPQGSRSDSGGLVAGLLLRKALPKFERLLETYLSYAPVGLRSFCRRCRSG